MTTDFSKRIRKAIEEAKPAEEYFSELRPSQGVDSVKIASENIYQARLDAVSKEYDALTQEDCVTESELKSIRALIAYAAFNNNMKEATVCAIVEAFFHVKEICKLPQQNYEAAIKYLVDFEVKNILN